MSRDILSDAFRESFPGVLASKDERKLKILERAIQEIGRHGVEGFNLGVLSRKLRISRSHLVYYFPTVADLLLAVVRLVTATAQRMTVEHLKEKITKEERIEAGVRAAFVWAREFPDQFTCMFMFFFYTGFDRKLLKLSDEIREVGRQRLQVLVGDAELALRIQVILTGHLVTARIHPSGGSLEDFEDRALKVILGQIS